MKDAKKSSDDKDRSCVKDVKVDLGTLNNTERACGVFDYAVDRSYEDKAAAEVQNDNPAFPRHCETCALSSRCLDDSTVDDMENGSEEAEEVDLE